LRVAGSTSSHSGRQAKKYWTTAIDVIALATYPMNQWSALAPSPAPTRRSCAERERSAIEGRFARAGGSHPTRRGVVSTVSSCTRREPVDVTDKKSTRIALSQITTLEQALDQAPARNTTEVSKARAIAILAPKLHALRAKGYAWRDVAAWLTEHGVSVTTPALQRYLRTAKPSLRREKGGAASRRSSASEEGGAPLQAATSPSTRVQAAVSPQPASRPATAPVQGTAESSARPQPPTRSGFVVRPDTKDI